MTNTAAWGVSIITALCLFAACGGGGSAELCKEVCAEQSAASCQPFGSLEQCNVLCDGYEGIGGDCLSTGEVYWQCQLDTNVCEPQACETEGMAFTLACSGQ